MLTNRQVRLIFSHLPHIGPVLCERLTTAFNHELYKIFKAPKQTLQSISGIGPIAADTLLNWERYVDLPAIEAALIAEKTTFLIPEDTLFPPLLKKMPDTPIGIYIKGPLRPTEKNIAIVGSRRATLYGRSVAKKLAQSLSQLGFCIVSGMARGIDAEAHESALTAAGATVAVLGTGIDIIYPPEHKALYQTLIEKGAVMSEFPLKKPADRQSFPLRNRIIAGLCHAIIVVESDLHGGSMITARLAGEYGRLLFAVPGRIDQPASRGCHALIRDGATLLTSVEDLLEALAPVGQLPLPFETPQTLSQPQSPFSKPSLSTEEHTLWSILKESQALSIDALVQTTTWPVHSLAGHLLSLELKKYIVKKADGTFENAL